MAPFAVFFELQISVITARYQHQIPVYIVYIWKTFSIQASNSEGTEEERVPLIKSDNMDTNSIDDPLVVMNGGEARWELSDASYSKNMDDGEEAADDHVWMSDLADEYDYCMVFPPIKEGEHHYLNDYTETLQGLGLEIFCYKEKEGDGNIIVLIRAPVNVLRSYADKHNFKMLMDEKHLEAACKTGNLPGIKPIEIQHFDSVIHYRPYELIYCKYSQRIDESLYYREESDTHPFQREVIRLKILSLIIESRPHWNGENIKLKRYVKYQRILGVFALHDAARKKSLAKDWLRLGTMPWRAPFHKIKEYFGEKLGLYYIFMGHYNRFLLIPAVVGMIVQIGVFCWQPSDIYAGFNTAPFLPFYSLFVSLWAIFMLEFWKRREKRMALEWGTADITKSDVLQPEFRGDRIKSFVDGSEGYLHFPTSTRNKYVFQSSLAIFGLTCLVVGVVASLYTIKQELVKAGVPVAEAQTYASVFNSVEIQATNLLYTFIANELTRRENHRTQAKYDDSLIVKIFVFQFINSFTSFYYLAFLSEVITASPDCGAHGCMFSLSVNLITIFAIRLVSQQVVGLVIPWMTFQYKLAGGAVMSVFTASKPNIRSRPELEYLLTPYDANESFIDEMMDSVIQFGFMSLFVTAFPGTAAVALASNLISLKGKAWKLLHIHQRPAPVAAEDIGQFQSLLLITTVAAVITNAALTVFTMNVLDVFSSSFQFWVFIGFQWVCFSAQAIIMEAIPDEPESIIFHRMRADYLESKVVDRVEDDIIEVFDSTGKKAVLQEYPAEKGGFFQARGSQCSSKVGDFSISKLQGVERHQDPIPCAEAQISNAHFQPVDKRL